MDWKQLYSGYLDTSLLWEEEFLGLEQLQINNFPTPALQSHGNPNSRLGFLAEHFTFEYWKQSEQVKIVARNIQINGENETLGEIDALLKRETEFIHVEIAFKIYLFDPDASNSSIECWIGPNRKDSLVDKINRIKTHQIPLIEKPETRTILEPWLQPLSGIKSKVWMKGLLFLPANSQTDISPLNTDCIAGRYIKRKTFNDLKESRFFLPSKQEWLITPHTNVDWSSYDSILEPMNKLLDREFAPMLWVKSPKGKLSRLFVVWW